MLNSMKKEYFKTLQEGYFRQDKLTKKIRLSAVSQVQLTDLSKQRLRDLGYIMKK